MNRREFFAFVNPFRAIDKIAMSAKPLTAEQRNDLFMRAMAQGIDPATMDLKQLAKLLGPKDNKGCEAEETFPQEKEDDTASSS